MNSVNLIGRTTKKPELKSTPKGKLVTRFTIAVPGHQDHTDFILVEVWGKQAENTTTFVDKGHRVAIMGEIKSSSYEKEGEKVYTTYVLANRVEFLEPIPKKDKGTQQETVPQTTEYDDFPPF